VAWRESPLVAAAFSSDIGKRLAIKDRLTVCFLRSDFCNPFKKPSFISDADI